MRKYDNIHQAYLGTLKDVFFSPDYVAAPRGQTTREKVNYQFSITNPLPEAIITKDLERNKVIEKYTAKEIELYDSCTNLASEFGKASSFWKKLANPDGTVNSAYGHLIWKNCSHGNPSFEMEPSHDYTRKIPMRTPWEWATESLRADKDTRQAILRFSLPSHQWIGNKDQTCTMHGIFLIRDNKLNFSVVMRSNDLVLGLVYDLPWFISLMDRMRVQLLDIYPSLVLGTYTHLVHSLHVYDRNEDTIMKMLGMSKN